MWQRRMARHFVPLDRFNFFLHALFGNLGRRPHLVSLCASSAIRYWLFLAFVLWNCAFQPSTMRAEEVLPPCSTPWLGIPSGILIQPFPLDTAQMALLALCFVVLLMLLYKDHAIGSIKIPEGVPVLPGNVPILGHSIQLLSNLHRLHDWLVEQARSMGDGVTFAFSLPFLRTYFLVTNPACVEHMVKTRLANYGKEPVFVTNLGPLLGHGIFTSDGERWLWQRKLATHIFSVKSFKQYIDVVFAQKMGLLQDVVQYCSASQAPVDLHDLMYRFTLDSFGTIGFGVDPGCLSSEGKLPFATAFDQSQVLLNERFWIPAWPLFELLTGRTLTISRNCAAIKRFAADIITRRRALLAKEAAGGIVCGGGKADRSGAGVAGLHVACAGAEEDETPRDLLSLFLEAVGPDGKPLDEKQLIDTVINFIIAGRDTTAQALSWTFYLLMQQPEVEEKLLAEIRQVLGPAALSDAAAKPSYDQIRQLKYARACFMEALRLYPSVPQDVKYAVEADVMPDGTHIPKNAQVMYSPFTVNRLKCFWGEDADEFRPERWLAMQSQPSPYSYLSFNAGPRICLGQRLAELEAVYVLTGLLARWHFRQVVPGTKVDYAVASTCPMKQGLQVFVGPRAASC